MENVHVGRIILSVSDKTITTHPGCLIGLCDLLGSLQKSASPASPLAELEKLSLDVLHRHLLDNLTSVVTWLETTPAANLHVERLQVSPLKTEYDDALVSKNEYMNQLLGLAPTAANQRQPEKDPITPDFKDSKGISAATRDSSISSGKDSRVSPADHYVSEITPLRADQIKTEPLDDSFPSFPVNITKNVNTTDEDNKICPGETLPEAATGRTTFPLTYPLLKSHPGERAPFTHGNTSRQTNHHEEGLKKEISREAPKRQGLGKLSGSAYDSLITDLNLDKSSLKKVKNASSPVSATVRTTKPDQAEVHICDLCGKSCNRRVDLEMHRRIHTGEKPYSCDLCTQSFTQHAHLTAHKRVHTGEKPFICETCGHAFSCRSNLRQHSRKHSGEKPYVCDVCGKAYVNRRNLVDHKLMHTGEVMYSCETCGKSFWSPNNLAKHVTIHSGETYACTLCVKSFTRQDRLKEHMRIHTGKTFACETCGKQFSRRERLQEHNNIHTGRRPFVCVTCGKAFRSRSDLSKHKHSHSLEKPHICDLCGMGFCLMARLKKHKKRKHKLGQEEEGGQFFPEAYPTIPPSVMGGTEIQGHQANRMEEGAESLSADHPVMSIETNQAANQDDCLTGDDPSASPDAVKVEDPQSSPNVV